MKNAYMFVMTVVAMTTAFTYPVAAAGSRPQFDTVALFPVSIAGTRVQGSSADPDNTVLVNNLQREATDRVAHDLVTAGVAAHVEQLNAGDRPPTGIWVVSGSIQIPVSIPRQALGMSAYYRYDWFAAADITFRRPDGTAVETQHAPIRWRDTLWCRHTHNRAGLWHVRNRPVDDVLRDAVDGVVDRAVGRAAKGLKHVT